MPKLDVHDTGPELAPKFEICCQPYLQTSSIFIIILRLDKKKIRKQEHNNVPTNQVLQWFNLIVMNHTERKEHKKIRFYGV